MITLTLATKINVLSLVHMNSAAQIKAGVRRKGYLAEPKSYLVPKRYHRGFYYNSYKILFGIRTYRKI